MYKYRTVIKVVLVVFILFTLYAIFSGLLQQEPESTGLTGKFEADGVQMAQSIYDKNNRKAIELRCRESRRVSHDKILMKSIEATILKKGRMNKDIKIYGDDGFVENNYHNFSIEKNGRIVSEDFDIRSPKFYLKNRAILRSNRPVKYRTASLTGVARKGMEYYLTNNVIKFFRTSGSYELDKKTHQYQTELLWYIEDDRKLILQKKSRIKSEDSLLKSDWISLTFFEDLENVRESSTIGNSTFFFGSREEKKYREIHSRNINSFYNADGQLESVEILKQGRVLIATPENTTRIQSDLIKILFEPESQKIKNAKLLFPGQIENQGKTDFTAWADQMNVDFKGGEVQTCQGTGNCRLKIDDYRIEAEAIHYDIGKHSIRITGNNSTVFHRENSFRSAAFQVNSKRKILKSEDGVKSTLNLGRENILFADDSIFVNARKINVLNEKKSFSYQGNVRLNQNNTILKAEKLEIDENNDLSAVGDVTLSFSSRENEEEIVLKGNRVTFDSKNKKISIQQSGVIRGKEATLKGDVLIVHFNEKNELKTIYGDKNIDFIKDTIVGHSQKVEWRFQQEFIVFTDSAELQKTGGGTAKGKRLELDLKTEKVVIVSDETKRTETILE
jgi:lipopolysaccharide transport protein LptA